MLNALFKTIVKYYALSVHCMRLIQITRHLNMLSIPTIPQVFSDSQLLIATIKNRIYHCTPVTNIETKNNLAADMASDEEIDLSNIPTAEMFTNCVIQSEPKLPFLEQFTAMVIVRIGYGNGLENGLAIVISN
jgi:hypothetical protein